jgi:hypothetical protein
MQNLDRLRTLLKREAPDWRIAVLGSNPQTTIIVYPTFVAFSEKGKEQEIVDAIRKELIDEQESKEQAKQQERRQIAWISHILKTRSFENLDLTQKPEVLAVFENRPGDNKFYCIWIINGDGGRFPMWWPIKSSARGYYSYRAQLDISLEKTLHPQFELGKTNFMGIADPILVEKSKFTKTIEVKSKWDWESKWTREIPKNERDQLPKAGKVVQLSLEGLEIISDEALEQKLIKLGIEDRPEGNENK